MAIPTNRLPGAECLGDDRLNARIPPSRADNSSKWKPRRARLPIPSPAAIGMFPQVRGRIRWRVGQSNPPCGASSVGFGSTHRYVREAFWPVTHGASQEQPNATLPRPFRAVFCRSFLPRAATAAGRYSRVFQPMRPSSFLVPFRLPVVYSALLKQTATHPWFPPERNLNREVPYLNGCASPRVHIHPGPCTSAVEALGDAGLSLILAPLAKVARVPGLSIVSRSRERPRGQTGGVRSADRIRQPYVPAVVLTLSS